MLMAAGSGKEHAEIVTEHLVPGDPKADAHGLRLQDEIHDVCKKTLFVFLLCVCGAGASSGQEPRADDPVVNVTIDFGDPLGRISPFLFGTNDQEALLPDTHVHRDEEFHGIMRELGFPMVRLHLGSMHGEFPTPDAKGSFLQSIPYYMDRTLLRADRSNQKIMVCFAAPPRWVDMHNPEQRERYTDMCAKYAGFLVKDREYNITHWELFNEIYFAGMSDLEKDPGRSLWKFYNRLAPMLREIAPGTRIGGPAVAWADYGVIQDFLEHCGAEVDFVSWHRYPAGSAEESTDAIMKRTHKFGEAVREVRRVVGEQLPGKDVELCITEYNMNGDWQPTDPRQATAVGACWAASILKHLADAGLDMAMQWHSKGGGSFGLVSAENEIRHYGALLMLLNRHLAGAELCRSTSSSRMVEMLAASTDDEYMALAINKSAEEKRVRLTLSHARVPAAGLLKRDVICYEIAEQQHPMTKSTDRLAEESQEMGRFLLLGYSVRLYVWQRNNSAF